MRATKLVINIKNLTYKDRFKRLKLPTVKYRRIIDMIEVGWCGNLAVGHRTLNQKVLGSNICSDAAVQQP